ncbi:acetyl-CoA hydrolase/transferase C-terminal domain-containing protein [Bosea sp. (in: a-proteobacteria)]|uniref:acetyl-CoA hydrolase/transferase family protein n=1 Tax=Bosea sp. (in: a-proteobacteria) TaxID=1871050 RepID=UPI0026372C2D|nr:acetyl-CoA hydrolase/transferase C-terminal domain-containing protein [Bosea sp. (in: a-proteobacteria)]MCO5089468.1 hypothetical protein [Bosea sp. (in: a-proteobacteria)]
MSTISIEDLRFADWMRSGDAVTWLGSTAEPVALISRLDAQAGDCPHFSTLLSLSFAEDLRPEHPNVTFKSFGGAGTNKRFYPASAGGVIACNVSNLCQLIAAGNIRVEVALVQVSGPDDQGRYNLGLGVQHMQTAIEKARVVIGQVNRNVPWTFGDTLVEGSAFDVLVEEDTPIIEPPQSEPTSLDSVIGEHIAKLVADGSVIQLGIGAVPNAVARALRAKRRLGVHAGVIGDGVLDLIEAGAIDNSRKEIDPGLTVTMGLLGSHRLNRYADRNMSLRVRSPLYTHDPVVLSQLSRIVAINSALEVDLTGQINAETAMGRHIGTIGGQGDFMRAAMRSREGRSIIALPATARRGTTSRIVARLADGAVTTPRADADIIVTEYGIAELRGRSLDERAAAMIAIAAPEFRKDLSAAAMKLC